MNDRYMLQTVAESVRKPSEYFTMRIRRVWFCCLLLAATTATLRDTAILVCDFIYQNLLTTTTIAATPSDLFEKTTLSFEIDPWALAYSKLEYYDEETVQAYVGNFTPASLLELSNAPYDELRMAWQHDTNLQVQVSLYNLALFVMSEWEAMDEVVHVTPLNNSWIITNPSSGSHSAALYHVFEHLAEAKIDFKELYRAVGVFLCAAMEFRVTVSAFNSGNSINLSHPCASRNIVWLGIEPGTLKQKQCVGVQLRGTNAFKFAGYSDYTQFWLRHQQLYADTWSVKQKMKPKVWGLHVDLSGDIRSNPHSDNILFFQYGSSMLVDLRILKAYISTNNTVLATESQQCGHRSEFNCSVTCHLSSYRRHCNCTPASYFVFGRFSGASENCGSRISAWQQNTTLEANLPSVNPCLTSLLNNHDYNDCIRQCRHSCKRLMVSHMERSLAHDIVTAGSTTTTIRVKCTQRWYSEMAETDRIPLVAFAGQADPNRPEPIRDIRPQPWSRNYSISIHEVLWSFGGFLGLYTGACMLSIVALCDRIGKAVTSSQHSHAEIRRPRLAGSSLQQTPAAHTDHIGANDLRVESALI